MIALYCQKTAPIPAANTIVCPACGKPHPEAIEHCPSCGLEKAKYNDPIAVKIQKRINTLPPDIRERYKNEVSKLFFEDIKQRRFEGSLDNQTIQDQFIEIQKRYHLIE
jgi:NMD protein affecting ribosome stability and mRNA decay